MSITRVVLYTCPRTSAQKQHERYNAHSASELGCLVSDFESYKSKFIGKTGGIFDVPRNPEVFTSLIKAFGAENISVVSIDHDIEKNTPAEFHQLTKHINSLLSVNPDFVKPKSQDSRMAIWHNQRHL